MIKVLLGLLLASVCQLASAQSFFAPLQPAHNGLWYDPEVPGVLVQVYPFQRANPLIQEAFIAVNSVDYDPDFSKSWQAFLISDFRGYSRTAVEDDLIGNQGDTTGRTFWRFSQRGPTCDALVAERFDAEGELTDVLNLVRIAPNNAGAVECYTCPEAAAGPHPPQCRR